MSTQVITDTYEDHRVLPQNGVYGASAFSTIISGISIVLIVSMTIFVIWGLFTTLLTISEFQEAAIQGFRPYAKQLNPDGSYQVDSSGNILYVDYMFWLRWSLGGYFLAFVIYFPYRWFTHNFARQSVTVSDEGIKIKKFPSTKYEIPWVGIIDITVKDSETIFARIAKNMKKITIYTMDRSISIESVTIANSEALEEQFRVFGDSLEERVIDFGYGAQVAIIWRRLKRSQVGVLGLILVVFWVAVAIFSVVLGIINPVNTIESTITQRTVFNFWNPNYVNVPDRNLGPSSDHPFGTDDLGRDLFSRVLFGSFYSILIGVIATSIAVTIGSFVGAASGYLGGTIDQIIQRFIEVLSSMPAIPILILISATFTPLFVRINLEGAYYLVVFAIFAFISWGGIARVIRSEVLALKNSEFIMAEKVLGATHYRIITKHIMPNAFSTVIIYFTLGIAGDIIGVATIAFLGFGSASTLVWGSDLSAAINNYPTRFWWGVTFISLCLFLLVLGFNLLGDALRDALDPRLKE